MLTHTGPANLTRQSGVLLGLQQATRYRIIFFPERAYPLLLLPYEG